MERLFASVISSLSNDEEICMLLAYAVTAEDIATFVAALKDRLSRVTTQNLPQHKDLFSEFLSFCSRRRYHHLIDQKLLQAKTAREERRDNRATMHKKLVRTLGLNWKSAQRTMRRMTQFASARHIYLFRLSDPYPPCNHWVADTQAIYTKWEYELLHGKLHDKRTGRHPMHLIDWTKLAAHVLPEEDAFIYDAATGLLICVIIRNFCRLLGPLAWVDYVVQEAVDHRRGARVCNALLSTHISIIIFPCSL